MGEYVDQMREDWDIPGTANNMDASAGESLQPEKPASKRKCQGTTRAGKPCKATAMWPTDYCRNHGGTLPKVRASNEIRKLRAKLWTQDLGKRFGVNRHPVIHMLDELHRSAWVVAVLAKRVQELGDEVAQRGEGGAYTEYHAMMKLWNEERDRHARLAKLCLDAGIAERQMRLAETQAEGLASVIMGVLEEMGVDMQRAPELIRKHLEKTMLDKGDTQATATELLEIAEDSFAPPTEAFVEEPDPED